MHHTRIQADESAPWPHNVTRQTNAVDFRRLINREAARLEASVKREPRK